MSLLVIVVFVPGSEEGSRGLGLSLLPSGRFARWAEGWGGDDDADAALALRTGFAAARRGLPLRAALCAAKEYL